MKLFNSFSVEKKNNSVRYFSEHENSVNDEIPVRNEISFSRGE